MKILFLDIDGVCNCAKTSQIGNEMFGIDPYLAFLVGKIIIETDCEVVLSSSWRHSVDGVAHVERRVHPIFDKTPRSNDGFRGKEVRAWLKEHPEVTRYAILDDSSDFYKYQKLFQTTWETGLTPEIADKVIKWLNHE